METEITTEAPKAVRPTFLIILCVLTFIGSSYSIYSAVSGYFTADISARIVSQAGEKASDQIGDKPQPDFVKSILSGISSLSADMIRKSSIIGLLAALLTLTGGVLMWSLRKYGFYIYIAGWFVAISGPVVLYGGNMIGIIAGVSSAVGALLFIILYGVNVKYLIK